MKPKRNPYLTPAMERVLRTLADDVDCDLVRERGEVWIGDERTSTTVLKRLVQLCLVGLSNHGDLRSVGRGLERYDINEEGRATLLDPEYVPRIVVALKNGGRNV